MGRGRDTKVVLGRGRRRGNTRRGLHWVSIWGGGDTGRMPPHGRLRYTVSWGWWRLAPNTPWAITLVMMLVTCEHRSPRGGEAV